MPLPQPNDGESEDAFISRCMGDETANADFPENEQRAAVCYRQWRGNKALEEFDALPLAPYDLYVPGNGTGARASTPKGMAFGEFLLDAGRELPAETIRELKQRQGTIGDLRIALQEWREGKSMDTTATDEAQTNDTAEPEAIDSNAEYTLLGDGAQLVSDNVAHWVVKRSDATDAPAVGTNALKAVSRTDDELRAANYIILFGGRDLEGLGSPRVNADGSKGEYFTKSTNLDSFYTRHGLVAMDWEHGQGELGDEILGLVDWKTARVDDKGVFVERVLNRRNRYVRWLEELGWFDDGTLGTSSHAMNTDVEKATDGAIVRWPIERDTITVQPMEPRMLQENQLQAFKALGIPVPNDTADEPETTAEASPEADTSAVDVARVKAELQLLLNSLSEEQ